VFFIQAYIIARLKALLFVENNSEKDTLATRSAAQVIANKSSSGFDYISFRRNRTATHNHAHYILLIYMQKQLGVFEEIVCM
jgi:hypothetical protein